VTKTKIERATSKKKNPETKSIKEMFNIRMKAASKNKKSIKRTSILSSEDKLNA